LCTFDEKITAVKKLTIVCFVFLALLFSCKDNSPDKGPSTLKDLPKDTGGIHKAIYLGADSSPYGYYLYTPSAYTSNGPRFPLLVFLHGSGESGNSQITPSALDKVLANGPPRLIKKGSWAPEYPMIVASAQCHDGWWDANKVHQFIEFLYSNYRVDTVHIYLTGLSMGGFGTYDQLTVFGAKSHLAAAIPIAGSGFITADGTRKASLVPFWAFHGTDDTTVLPDFDKSFIPVVNALNPAVRAKLTMYPATGHDSWSKTYDGTGMGKEDPAYDPFKMDIYSWMFQYSKK
jgi:predicted peptidase